MFYNFLIKFCLVSVLILISACSSQSLNSDSSINNQADSLELESYELEISQLMQSYEEAEESDSDSLDSYFHEENSTANSEVTDNVIDNDVVSGASFSIVSVEITDHVWGSYLSDGVIITIEGDVSELQVSRITNEFGTTYLGTYQVNENGQIIIERHNLIQRLDDDFSFRIQLSDGVTTLKTKELNYIRTVDVRHKQKALYAKYTYNPSLTSQNTYDYQVIYKWDDFQDMREYGKNGIYAATTTGFANGPGGYFGMIVLGDETRGSGILFSFWDSKKHNKLAIPYDDGSYEGNCYRNCQDHNCEGVLNGGKCNLKYEIKEGVEYALRMRRVSENVTYVTTDAYDSSKKNVSYTGSIWQLSVENRETGDIKIVGKLLFEDTYTGIKKANFFHEHLGKVPCNAFYVKQSRGIEFLDTDREVSIVGASASVNGAKNNSTCNSFNVGLQEDGVGVFFETGIGVEPDNGFKRGKKYILF
jgi:hypothetical protein